MFQQFQPGAIGQAGGVAVSQTTSTTFMLPGLGDLTSQRCAGLSGGDALGGLSGGPGMALGGAGFGTDPRLMMMLQMQVLDTFVDLLALMLNSGGSLMQAMAQAGRNGASATVPGGGGGGIGGGSSAGGGGQAMGGPNAAGGANAPSGPIGNVNVENIVKALPSANQKAAREHFPGILAECQKQGVTDKAQIAYILATTVHESGAGAHLEEFASGSAYEGRSDLGNNQSGDGVRFKGRGYVQVTGRNNYTDWSRRLGIDLVGNPEKAEDPAIAARILVQGMKEGTFTGKKLSDYIGNGKTDFNGARRIVNGTDKAATFAATAQKIQQAMG